MERKCEKCGKVSQYIFLKVYRSNSIYVDANGNRWKNSKTCPDCFKNYNTSKTKQRREKLRK